MGYGYQLKVLCGWKGYRPVVSWVPSRTKEVRLRYLRHRQVNDVTLCLAVCFNDPGTADVVSLGVLAPCG